MTRHKRDNRQSHGLARVRAGRRKAKETFKGV